MKARFFRSDAATQRLGAEVEDRIIDSPGGFQLTYGDLRSAPDGELIAYINGEGYWEVASNAREFSDVVIFNDGDEERASVS